MRSRFPHTSRSKTVLLAIAIIFSVTVGFTPNRADAFFTGAAQLAVEVWEKSSDIVRDIGKKIKEQYKTAGKIAYKNALRTFSTRMAYQVAVDLASAANGQEPVFWKKKPFRYLQDAADSAAADFIETLATQRTCRYPDSAAPADFVSLSGGGFGEEQNFVDAPSDQAHPYSGRPCSTDDQCPGGGTCAGGFGFSICEFDPSIQFQIQAGFATDLLGAEVRTSKCSFYEDIWKGVPNRLADKSFNEYFVTNIPNYFKEGNTTVQYLAYFNDAIERRDEVEEAASLERAEGGGFRPLSNLVGDIQTPGRLFQETYSVSLFQAILPETVFTDDILADTIGVFANTLISKYVELAFQGISPDSDPEIRFSFGGTGAAGRAGARARFASIAQPSFQKGGDISLLTDMASCPGQERGPKNCVFDDSFRQAVEDGLRLKDAAPTRDRISQGATPYIPRDQLFGFGPLGRVLTLEEGIPYNSIVVMTHYRIVPASWEIAAQYIRDYESEPKTLGDLMDAFYDPESPYYQLVDPEWVLKAPAAYCQREGYSDILFNDEYIDTDATENTPKERLITRGSTCVDERTCIAEDPDTGECRAFGYCTQEQRSWKFSGEACDLEFASCQAYLRGDNGEEVAYLANTFNDSSACEEGNAGCEFYCTNGALYDYLTDSWSCVNDPENLLGTVTQGQFLDNEAAECPDDETGCQRLLSTDTGSNLVNNPSFEYIPQDVDFNDCATHDLSVLNMAGEPAGWVRRAGSEACLEAVNPYDGLYTYNVTMNPGTHLDYNIAFENRSGTLDNGGKHYSAQYAMRSDAESRVNVQLLVGGTQFSIEQHTVGSEWELFTVTGELGLSQVGDITLRFIPQNGADFSIDYVHLQEGEELGSYQQYGVDNASHMRVAPRKTTDVFDPVNLYDCTGDVNDDARCADFAPVCSMEEVGCELYTPTNADPAVPGIIGETCNEEEAGCQLFRQESLAGITVGPLTDIPERGEAEFPFVASKATQCSATEVGCEEFTNLSNDQGEQLEYYSSLRQCVVTGTGPTVDVETYLSWNVSEGGGYELFEERLLSTNLSGNAPCTHLSVGENPEILTCEDTPANVIDCTAEFGTNPGCREYTYIDDTSGAVEKYYRYASLVVYESEQCDPLRNTIDQTVYFIDTERSRTCSAAAASCREFAGNSGSNSVKLFYDEFEESISPWTGGASLASETPIPNQVPADHSMDIVGDAHRPIEGGASTGETYILEFWAKGDTETDFYLNDGSHKENLATNFVASLDWQFYRVGPLTLTEAFDSSTELHIENVGVNRMYVDNILLRRISDRVYLVKDSLLENDAYCKDVGCQEYRDRQGEYHYVKTFKRLCRDGAIGCELFVSSHNTATPYPEKFDMSGTADLQTRVPQDTMLTLVNSPSHACSEQYQGCRDVGRAVYGPIDDGGWKLGFKEYVTEQRIVNEENFDTAVCDVEARACEELIDNDTGKSSFVKDPEESLCEFKVPSTGGSANWYIKDVDGDVACPITSLRGVDSDPPVRPSGDFVGMCPAAQSSCEIYRDPQDPVACESACPYIETEGGAAVKYTVDSSGRCVEDSDGAPGCREYPMLSSTLESDCDLVGDEPVAVDQTCKLFRDDSNGAVNYSSDLSASGAPFLCKNETSGEIIGTCTSRDDATCEGVPDQVCINNDPLGPPVACDETVVDPNDPNYCDSNITLRVRPDRTCSEWLACKFAEEVDDPQDIDNDNQYKEYQCRQVGRCNELTSNYQCANFLDDDAENQTADMPDLDGTESSAFRVGLFDKLKSSTGYSLVGLHWGCSNDPTQDCRTNADCGDGICRIVEGTYPAPAMVEAGMQTMFEEMITDGTFENNALTQFPGACYGNSSTQLIDKPCLNNVQCTTGFEGEPAVGECTHDPETLGGIKTIGATSSWQVFDHDVSGKGKIVVVDEVVPGEVLPPIQSAKSIDLLDGNNVLEYHPDSGDIANSTGVLHDLSTTVSKNGEYVVSFDAFSNSSNPFSGDTVPLRVYLYTTTGQEYNFVDDTGSSQITLAAYRQQYILTLNTGAIAPDEVSLVFDSNDGDAHSFTLDNVSMRPALDYQQTYSDLNSSVSSLLTPECRSYPEQDSPYCDYSDENFVQHRGWGGYCLRKNPNLPQQCLTWWPVDIISGDAGIDVGQPAGYAGPVPLYYCVNSKVPLDHGNEGGHDNGVGDALPNDAGALVFPDTVPAGETPASYCGELHNFWRWAHTDPGQTRCNYRSAFWVVDDVSYRPAGPKKLSPFMQALRKEDVLYFNAHVAEAESHSDWPNAGVVMQIGREERIYDNTELGCTGGADYCKAWSGVDVLNSAPGEDWILKFGSETLVNDVGPYWDVPAEGCGSENFAAITVHWDEDGRLQRYVEPQWASLNRDNRAFSARVCDGSSSDGGAEIHVYAVLNEVCTTVAQVSEPRRTYAWVENTTETTPIGQIDESDADDYCDTHSCLTGYTYNGAATSDKAPFGAIRDPIGPVSLWDGSLESMSQEPGPLMVMQDDTNGTPNQVRAGLAYSQNTVAQFTSDGDKMNYRRCVYGDHLGGASIDGANAEGSIACLIDSDCGDGGLCVGSRGVCSETRAYCDEHSDCTKDGEYCLMPIVPLNRNQQHHLRAPIDRISFLFAKAVNIWEWDYDTHEYKEVVSNPPGGGDPEAGNNLLAKWDTKYANMSRCEDVKPFRFTSPSYDTQSYDDRPMFFVKRTDYLSDRSEGYCGYEPEVQNVQINNQTSGTFTMQHGDIIELSFNSIVNPQQRALQMIYIDWKGDRSEIASILWDKLEKSDPGDPHKFTYRLECEGNTDCLYEPKVLLVDNWDWCTTGVDRTGGYRAIARSGYADSCVEESGAWVDSGIDITVYHQ